MLSSGMLKAAMAAIRHEYSMYQLGAAIGKALVELGVHEESEPTPFTDEELVKYFGSRVSASFTKLCSARTDV